VVDGKIWRAAKGPLDAQGCPAAAGEEVDDHDRRSLSMCRNSTTE
jgi:hypothetical protein